MSIVAKSNPVSTVTGISFQVIVAEVPLEALAEIMRDDVSDSS
jgi:hypothetical protein